jgi:transcriptional repressor of dcmA and dcmR
VDLLAFLERQPGDSRGSVARGTHLCGFYASEEGQVRQALIFLAEGFRPGTVTYLVGTGETRGRILAGLEREQPGLGTAIAEGRLVVSDYADSAAAQLKWWETWIGQALRRGATLVRAIGDASAFIQAASREELFQYEAEYDRRIAHRFPVVTMCQYDVREFTGLLVVDALRAHPHCFGQSAERILA